MLSGGGTRGLMRILLVDDSEPVREVMAWHLIALGHEVMQSDDGEQALAILAEESFELIVTDLQMPSIGGLELLAHVKKSDPDQDVIIVTGYGDMDSSVEALRLGAANYLQKPVNLEELSLAVSAIEKRQALDRRLKEQEVRLAQARKMADLGLVAAGMAHEINNPNTFVRGNIQTLMKVWDQVNSFIEEAKAAGVNPPPRLEYLQAETPNILEAMLKGTDRIRWIIDHVNAFSRVDEDEGLGLVDVNSCVLTALEGLGGHDGILAVVTSLAPDLPQVRATAESLSTVVTELVKNSLKAVDGRPEPRIVVATEYSDSDEIILTISDNGSGIKAEDKWNVCTPFFTTDPRIGRPGLGLSKVYALVLGFGGDITFSSKLEEGTVFTVKLPFDRKRR